jgi:hypothetical protein
MPLLSPLLRQILNVDALKNLGLPEDRDTDEDSRPKGAIRLVSGLPAQVAAPRPPKSTTTALPALTPD